MNEWINLEKVIPGLKGLMLYTVKTESSLLKKILEKEKFKVYLINGDKIIDEKTFFKEVKQSLEFPSYFGNNWGAWDDSLFNEFLQFIPQRTAVIWNHADLSFNSDAQTFLRAVCDLFNVATNVALDTKSNPNHEIKQMEVFFLGESNGFSYLSLQKSSGS